MYRYRENRTIEQMLAEYPGRRYEKPDWRHLFASEVLKSAEESHTLSYYKRTPVWDGRVQYTFQRVYPRTTVYIHAFPENLGDRWEDCPLSCSCRKNRCVHMAAALLYEEKNNPEHFTIWESRRDYMTRMEDSKYREEKAKQRRLAKQSKKLPAADAFEDRKEVRTPLFNWKKALEPYTTTEYAKAHIKAAEAKKNEYHWTVKHETSRDGKHRISFNCDFHTQLERVHIYGELQMYQLVLIHMTQMSSSYYYREDWDPVPPEEQYQLDEYDLVVLTHVLDEADRASYADVTDDGGKAFLKSIKNIREKASHAELPSMEEIREKKEVVTLIPRIVIENGYPMLSMKIGREGGRKYVVKDCFRLIDAVNDEKVYLLGKSDQLDFSKETLTDASQPVYEYIQRNKVQPTCGTYQLDLRHSRLDTFYDKLHGVSCELLDKTNQIKDEMVPVGHTDIHFTLTGEELTDANGNFMGVVVSGFVPVLLSGSSHKYKLDRQGLSRISNEERDLLKPFTDVADPSGYFRFQVGKDRLAEFFYQVLPVLLENPCVEYIDHCSEAASAFLPPEAQFTFYVDLEADQLLIRTEVTYDEKTYTLTNEPSRGGYHDYEQEGIVRETLKGLAPEYDERRLAYSKEVDDDSLYQFLVSGMPVLEYYGKVKGSAALRNIRVLPQPQVQVGVSVSSGNLLDISVTSKSMDPKELLELYNSYIRKKRFYRIKSGDFIDLSKNDQLKELDAFLGEIDLKPASVLQDKIQIPMYRALYLNKRLEDHEKLSSVRDRTYRALIRGFKTVRDAEFEVPESLENVLRPYQTFGYKWLRTLQAAGFGGILADEMGLGKTLQMISVFLANKAEKGAKHRPSLVVCPASLVYNWQEEIERFAPQLSVQVIAGTTGVRKKLIEGTRVDAAPTPDVLITSYDLLKRDIPLYESIEFENCVIDEAQYIKNSKSAAAKSVKLIKARHRFALTGTPIENRLSELWSIFDFLMPGFLYSQTEFEKKFETPIVKQKDEDATARLKDMTGPFILRRLKMDVLTDLPEKLEEVRYARISGEQQRLYDAQVVRMKQMLSGGELAGEEKIKIFAELMRIRQICCDPSLLFENYSGESAKREACLDLIQSAIEGGHRMLVFSQFVSMLELLEADLQRLGIPYYKIVGATPKERRVVLVRDFNEGDVPVFLISLKAGGTGLNLTGADVVIHYDPWWNLSVQNQATDRAHRIGQTRQVTVFKLIVKDSIEERILELQNAKKDLAEAILEGSGESLLSLSSEELLALLGA